MKNKYKLFNLLLITIALVSFGPIEANLYQDAENSNGNSSEEKSNGESEKQKLITKLRKSFEVIDMSDNSIAKTHVRYMVGGHANAENEIIYHFEFPERPGALLNFLKK